MLIASEVERRRAPRPGTFPLEQLSVTLAGGSRRLLALKRLAWGELGPDARLGRPRFLFDPMREPAVYRWVLPEGPPGPPRCFNSEQSHGDGGECWLLLEWVDGEELFQVGELETWSQAARWLGELHARLAIGVEEHAARGRLLRHDPAFHRRWMERARRFAGEAGRPRGDRRFLTWLARRHDNVVEALAELPRTVLHGDFNAANVLVRREDDRLRIAAVDWEMAASGSGLIDLASLLSGRWSAVERSRMVAAYAGVEGVPTFSARELDFARLQLCVQWLGWAPSAWTPPEPQRHDWIGDASELAEELGL